MVLTLFTVLKIIGIVILVLLGTYIICIIAGFVCAGAVPRQRQLPERHIYDDTARIMASPYRVCDGCLPERTGAASCFTDFLAFLFFDTFRNKKAKPTKTKGKPTGEIQAASSEKDDSGYLGSEETFQEENFQEKRLSGRKF